MNQYRWIRSVLGPVGSCCLSLGQADDGVLTLLAHMLFMSLSFTQETQAGSSSLHQLFICKPRLTVNLCLQIFSHHNSGILSMKQTVHMQRVF